MFDFTGAGTDRFVILVISICYVLLASIAYGIYQRAAPCLWSFRKIQLKALAVSGLPS